MYYRLSMETLKEHLYIDIFKIWFGFSLVLTYLCNINAVQKTFFMEYKRKHIIHHKNITLVSSDLHFSWMIIMISTVLDNALSAGSLYHICHYCVGYSLNIESNKSNRFNIWSIYYDGTTVHGMKVIIYQE